MSRRKSSGDPPESLCGGCPGGLQIFWLHNWWFQQKFSKKKIIWICQLHSPFYRKPSGRLLSHTVLFLHTSTIKSYKGGLIPEDISTMVSSTTKSAKSLKENLNKVFTVIGEKLKFPAQESDLAPFVGNGTKVKIPYEIKPPLEQEIDNLSSKLNCWSDRYNQKCSRLR